MLIDRTIWIFEKRFLSFEVGGLFQNIMSLFMISIQEQIVMVRVQ